jgi:enamine deaminase RidA (YjgF/YER057c/UK114 family)
MLWKFKKTVHQPSPRRRRAPTSRRSKKAKKQLEEVQKALDEVLAAIEKLRQEREQLAKLKIELQEADRRPRRRAEAYNDKCSALEDQDQRPATSSMQKSKAQNELAQLKSEDPLPLRRAKITSEAAIRKVEKQEKAVDAAIADMERKQESLSVKLQEAQEELERIQQQGGEGGKGSLWLMNRKLYEADSYLAKRQAEIRPQQDVLASSSSVIKPGRHALRLMKSTAVVAAGAFFSLFLLVHLQSSQASLHLCTHRHHTQRAQSLAQSHHTTVPHSRSRRRSTCHCRPPPLPRAQTKCRFSIESSGPDAAATP